MFILSLKIKKYILPTLFCLFLVCLVVFSKQNLIASKNGLVLWATCLVPSLFPFFVATELLNSTNIPTKLSKIFSKIMYPLFNSPGEAAYAFIMGIICGYPVGAKIIGNFYNEKLCSKCEAERMLAFTNNSGPLFIIGTVGITLFCNSDIGILLFITHILACITVGILFGIVSRYFTKIENRKRYSVCYENKCNFSNLGEILATSINSAISTILLIGGFVILFSVIISIINNLNIFNNLPILQTIITGLLEITNGINLCSKLTNNLNFRILLCSFLLGFGGISVLLQILSIASKYKLSIKWYLFGKLLQGIFASLYTYILLNSFIWRFFYG